MEEVMEPVTRVGVELLEKLKRKADKYWRKKCHVMTLQQRVYRASKGVMLGSANYSLLGKLKRKADKYWMSPQQRAYRASKGVMLGSGAN